MMKSFLKLFALGLIVFVCSRESARAGTLTLGNLTTESMSITFNSATSDQFGFASGSFDGLALELYCVDLTMGIAENFTYPQSLSTNDGTIFGTAVPNATGIAWLLDTYANAARASEDTRLGLQAAIWQVEYGNLFSLNSIGTSAGILSAFSTYYTNGYLSGGPNTAPVSDITWIGPSFSNGVDDQYQGLAGVHPVPEPSSFVLLLGMAASVLTLKACRRSSLLS